jgi:hypothetical protein
LRLSRAALDHLLSDGDHQVGTPFAKVPDDDALGSRDV